MKKHEHLQQLLVKVKDRHQVDHIAIFLEEKVLVCT